MRSRSAVSLVLLIALAILIGCNRPSSSPDAVAGPGTGAPGGTTASAGTPDDENANVGATLFSPAARPKYPDVPRAGLDPIVIPNCTVQYEDRQQVSAEVDGKIDLIATPFVWNDAKKVYEHRLRDGSGTVIEHNPAAFAADVTKLHTGIVFNPRDLELFPDQKGGKAQPENRMKWYPYWKLADSMPVAAGDVLCVLDDSLVNTKLASAEKIKKTGAKILEAAAEGVKKTQRKIDLTKDSSVVSEIDKLNDLITLGRFLENEGQAFQSVARAEADYDEALVLLRKHRITSRVNGIIRNVARRPGEFLRAGEKILDIQSTERVRLEGSVDVTYYDQLRNVKNNALPVTVEPAIPSAPVRSHASHSNQLGVAGIAVTGNAERPQIVSAGLDGRVLVWEPKLTDLDNRPAFPRNLPHPVAVRSVVCTPRNSKPVLAITGADDGKVRIWDLSNPDKVPTAPLHEATDVHASAIHAIAISSDGKFVATAAGREVFIWDVASGKKLYALPAEHRDTITSVSFTPQCQLVTVSKDRTLKRWKLGKEKAAVARTIDHRSGVVDVLGVSPDGGRVLFDEDKSRIDMMDLAEAQTVGQINNAGPSVAFANLAVFAPDFAAPGTPIEQLPPYAIVTAGGEGDLKGGVQVWELARAGGRGAERARFFTPGRVAVTCAAFGIFKVKVKAKDKDGKEIDMERDVPALVVGTEKGTVHVWTAPSGPAKRIEGHITSIDATDPSYVTVRVEMTNPGLLDRSAATVIVNPGK